MLGNLACVYTPATCRPPTLHVCMCACVYVCMCVCVYVRQPCICVYMTHVHTNIACNVYMYIAYYISHTYYTDIVEGGWRRAGMRHVRRAGMRHVRRAGMRHVTYPYQLSHVTYPYQLLFFLIIYIPIHDIYCTCL
jgi:hypothetical protein